MADPARLERLIDETEITRVVNAVDFDVDRAEVLSQGYAWNKLRVGHGDDLWETWGTYRHTLARTAAGWKVTGMAYFARHSRGNEKVREYVPGAGA